MEVNTQQFISGISHELKNLCALIDMSVGTLREKIETGEKIEEEIAKLEGCIKVIRILAYNLEYSRLPSENRIFSGITNTKELFFIVQKWIDILQRTHSSKNLCFRIEGFDKINPISLPLDSKMLECLCFNVIKNAIQYSFKNTDIIVNCSISTGQRGIVLDVIDTGLIITEDETKHYTEPFWRGRIAGATTPYGAGLGLFIVKEILAGIRGNFQI
ncbi:MAG: sensor histidine kinase [Planctomycetota bacterium]|jgi:signal transduction histidine kinase